MAAGLTGEEKLRYILSDYFFKSDVTIFYNFECLNAHGFSHQMDALLITPHFLVIFEVKQISGTLFYKPAQHEFFRSKNDVIENFTNPFDQAFRHQLFIEQQLKKWQVSIPVHHLVAIANVRAKLDHSLTNYPIMHISGIPQFLENLYEQHPKSSVDCTFLQQQFEQLYTRLPPRRKVDKQRLRQGVLCEKCQYANEMSYRQGYFICNVCQTKSKDALLESLLQYRILISPHITNRAFREFFKIDCVHVASKLLNRLGLEKKGLNKGAYYIIPEKW